MPGVRLLTTYASPEATIPSSPAASSAVGSVVLLTGYGHVLHEMQLNAWVLAYRRAIGPVLIGWDGATDEYVEGPARRT